jgi:hypothetical protein
MPVVGQPYKEKRFILAYGSGSRLRVAPSDGLLAGRIPRKFRYHMFRDRGLFLSSYEATSIELWGFHPDDVSNPSHFPKALSLDTIVGLSFYLFNISPGGSHFNTW